MPERRTIQEGTTKPAMTQQEKEMISIAEMVRRAGADGFTRDDARAMVDARVEEMVTTLGDLTPEEARRQTLVNIGYWTGYLDSSTADRIMELFETEHPIWGRTHPTPAEILQRFVTEGRRLREQRKEQD
jgi:hypothetical protein